MADVTRRKLMAGLAASAAGGMAAMGTGCEGMKREGAVKTYKNSHFYTADGKFDLQAAQQAYFQLFEVYHYPVSKGLLDNWWVVDFSLGRFTDVGMGGIFWINSKENDFFGHDIFLLPGQMIPEHIHIKTKDARAKMEGWHCRRGSITLFGEGDPSPDAEKIIPASELKFTTVRHTTHRDVGEVGWLNRAEAKHFMVAGPHGAIASEYASYHDNAALRFTDPKIKF